MGFWREFKEVEKDCPAARDQLPPLTDEMVAACEKRFGVKFPAAYLRLLRTQNGGLLENYDFKIREEQFRISKIEGLDATDLCMAVRPCSFILDEDEDFMDWRGQLTRQAGDPSKLLLFAENVPYSCLFNYNQLNSAGEPTILHALMDEDRADVWPVANSFEELMRGHYFGDPEPIVRLEEADTFKLIAAGGYSGKRMLLGKPIKVSYSWKIGLRSNHVIVLLVLVEDHPGEGEVRNRYDIPASSLSFDRKCIVRESHLREPRGYALCLGTPPGARGLLGHESKAYQGKWKNSSLQSIYVKVYSADKAALEQAQAAVTDSLSG